MNWEETIKHVRALPEMEDLVRNSYLGPDLEDNVHRYENSEEFLEFVHQFEKRLGTKPLRILDVGAGNGITTIALAKKGHEVTILEPDPSELIGYGVVIKYHNDHPELKISYIKTICEELDKKDCFDLVVARQSMHHADNLKIFVQKIYDSIVSGGAYFALRDHVLLNEKEKEKFLEVHPLHKFYKGENAYVLKDYLDAFHSAGFGEITYFKYFESILNHYPLTVEEIEAQKLQRQAEIKASFRSKLGVLSSSKLLFSIYLWLFENKYGKQFDEKDYVGRPYSFISVKG